LLIEKLRDAGLSLHLLNRRDNPATVVIPKRGEESAVSRRYREPRRPSYHKPLL